VSDVQQRLARGRGDICYFAEEVLGIKLNPGHRRWFKMMVTGDDDWSWTYTLTAHVAANQIGKTVGLAIIILWACTYKIGVPFGASETELKTWLDSPYLWFHLAPSQNQAYHVLNDIRFIIKGAHPAQDVGRTKYGLGFHYPTDMVREDTVATYYQGLYFANGAVCQFRTTEEKAKAILGYRANGISVDEAAFENHLKAIVNEVLLMRLISTNGPLILVSTPDGINDFYEVVEMIRQGAVMQEGDTLWLDPPHHQGLTFSTIADNVGFGVTQEFVDRMEETLDAATKEAQLRGAFLNPAEAFFVPSDRILKAFTARLPNEMMPKPGHRYVIFWDPSVSSDPTACIILDVTKKPWVGVRMVHERKPRGTDRLLIDIWQTHTFFNAARDDIGRTSWAITGFDATGMGGQMIRQSLKGLTPVKAINFAGTSKIKRDAFMNLKTAILQGQLLIPDSWTPVKREVLNYRLDDESIQQDLVFALAGAVLVAGQNSGILQAPFDPSTRVAPSYWR
jgi:hypothetical protein